MDNVTIETIATLIGCVYLLLQVRASNWMWVASLIMSILYTYLNYAFGLYVNAIVQIIFSILAVVGLLQWLGVGRKQKELPITSMPRREILPIVLVTIALAAIAIAILHSVGEGSRPVLDGITAAINLTGTWLLIRKYYQEWICWMIVDPLMCIMYAIDGHWASAALYAIFSIVVVYGFLQWRKKARE